jgi:hypothetical protein
VWASSASTVSAFASSARLCTKKTNFCHSQVRRNTTKSVINLTTTYSAQESGKKLLRQSLEVKSQSQMTCVSLRSTRSSPRLRLRNLLTSTLSKAKESSDKASTTTSLPTLMKRCLKI